MRMKWSHQIQWSDANSASTSLIRNVLIYLFSHHIICLQLSSSHHWFHKILYPHCPQTAFCYLDQGRDEFQQIKHSIWYRQCLHTSGVLGGGGGEVKASSRTRYPALQWWQVNTWTRDEGFIWEGSIWHKLNNEHLMRVKIHLFTQNVLSANLYSWDHKESDNELLNSWTITMSLTTSEPE